MGRASYMCGMAFACTRPGEPCVQVNANRATHRPTNGKSTVRRQSMQKVAVRCEDFRSQATYIGVSRPPWRLATPTRKAGRRLTVVRTRSLSRDPPSPALFLPAIFPASAVAQDLLYVRQAPSTRTTLTRNRRTHRKTCVLLNGTQRRTSGHKFLRRRTNRSVQFAKSDS